MNENEQLAALEGTAAAVVLAGQVNQEGQSTEKALRSLLASPIFATEAEVQHVLAFAERATSGAFGMTRRLQHATVELEHAVEVAHRVAPGVLRTGLLLNARETADIISRQIFPPAHLRAIAQGIGAKNWSRNGHSCRSALVRHSGILEMVNPPTRERLDEADRVNRERGNQRYWLPGAQYDPAVAERDQAAAQEENVSRRLGWILTGRTAPMPAAQLRDWFDEHHPGLTADGQRVARVLRALGESRMAGCRQIQLLMEDALYDSGAARIVADLLHFEHIMFDVAMEIEQGA
jgi:hypothetical protein